MKRKYRYRPLAYEQLESKAAPSSILMVLPHDGADAIPAIVASNSVATHLSHASERSYESDQILRFVAENTRHSERAHRTATLPSVAQCVAADEMMEVVPAAWNSLLVLGFYDDGTGL